MITTRPARTPGRADHRQWDVLAAVSIGGGLGSAARYGLTLVWPVSEVGFPWATWVANVSGGFVIGALMVLLSEIWSGRRLVRPFVGVGILGGYTTFSTYIVDLRRLIDGRAGGVGLLYLVGTPVAVLATTTVAVLATRLILKRLRGNR